jgi:hypothetical protein
MKILIPAFHEKKLASDGILLGLRLCYESSMSSPLTILITSRAYVDSIKKIKHIEGHSEFSTHPIHPPPPTDSSMSSNTGFRLASYPESIRERYRLCHICPYFSK